VIGIIGRRAAANKSTIAKYPKSLGGVWLDADKLPNKQTSMHRR